MCCVCVCMYVCLAAVCRSKCPGYVGITGIVVQETQNTFKLICKDNRVRSEHALHNNSYILWILTGCVLSCLCPDSTSSLSFVLLPNAFMQSDIYPSFQWCLLPAPICSCPKGSKHIHIDSVWLRVHSLWQSPSVQSKRKICKEVQGQGYN